MSRSRSKSFERDYPPKREMQPRGRSSASRPRPSSASTKVYVGNLLGDITVEELRSAFEQYGKINDCTVNRNVGDGATSFGFVEFDKVAYASKSIRRAHGNFLLGLKLKVEVANNSSMLAKPRVIHKPPFNGSNAAARPLLDRAKRRLAGGRGMKPPFRVRKYDQMPSLLSLRVKPPSLIKNSGSSDPFYKNYTKSSYDNKTTQQSAWSSSRSASPAKYNSRSRSPKLANRSPSPLAKNKKREKFKENESRYSPDYEDAAVASTMKATMGKRKSEGGAGVGADSPIPKKKIKNKKIQGYESDMSPVRGGQPDTRRSPVRGGQPDTRRSPVRGGQPDTRRSPVRGQPDTRRSPIRGGLPDTRRSPVRGGQPDARRSVVRGQPDTRRSISPNTDHYRNAHSPHRNPKFIDKRSRSPFYATNQRDSFPMKSIPMSRRRSPQRYYDDRESARDYKPVPQTWEPDLSYSGHEDDYYDYAPPSRGYRGRGGSRFIRGRGNGFSRGRGRVVRGRTSMRASRRPSTYRGGYMGSERVFSKRYDDDNSTSRYPVSDRGYASNRGSIPNDRYYKNDEYNTTYRSRGIPERRYADSWQDNSYERKHPSKYPYSEDNYSKSSKTFETKGRTDISHSSQRYISPPRSYVSPNRSRKIQYKESPSRSMTNDKQRIYMTDQREKDIPRNKFSPSKSKGNLSPVPSRKYPIAYRPENLNSKYTKSKIKRNASSSPSRSPSPKRRSVSPRKSSYSKSPSPRNKSKKTFKMKKEFNHSPSPKISPREKKAKHKKKKVSSSPSPRKYESSSPSVERRSSSPVQIVSHIKGRKEKKKAKGFIV